MERQYFTFREPRTLDELKALLLLRYSVYRVSRLRKYIVENDACIDLDGYDMNSLHFGLYQHADHASRPVGYVRIVTDERGPLQQEIVAAASLSPILEKRVHSNPGTPLPCMRGTPYDHQLATFFQRMKKQGGKVAEASRLSLCTSVRGGEMPVFFVSAISAACIVHGVKHALTLVPAAHSRFYKRFGFETFDGTSDFHLEEYDVHDLIMHGGPDRLPAGIREQVHQMAQSYFNTGMISHYPGIPAQYYPVRESYIESRPAFTGAAA